MAYPSIIETIGNTPLVALRHMNENKSVTILAKLEGNNPGGSVKDRPALAMIETAEKEGMLSIEKTILEPTSGNTGIALAMIGAAKGYRVTLVMPESASIERRKVIEAYGAEIVLTPAAEKTDGAIRKAHELLTKHPELYFMPNQFDNPANPLSHYLTTGPEIWEQTGGEIDIFIAALGTSGTLCGVGKYLKEKKGAIRIVALEPTKGHTIQGLKNMDESIVPGIYDCSLYDEKATVSDAQAFSCAKELARKEGIFTGMSGGAAIAACLQIAKTMSKGTIVTILPDRGDRYLSTSLFLSS